MSFFFSSKNQLVRAKLQSGAYFKTRQTEVVIFQKPIVKQVDIYFLLLNFCALLENGSNYQKTYYDAGAALIFTSLNVHYNKIQLASFNPVVNKT